MSRWVGRLPEETILADPPVAFVAAWIGGYSGASKQQSERWLAVVDAADSQGPLPDGISSLAFGAALARASVPFDEAGGALQAARRALELAGTGALAVPLDCPGRPRPRPCSPPPAWCPGQPPAMSAISPR